MRILRFLTYLLVPLALCLFASLVVSPVGTKNFLADYSSNLRRLFAGDWEFAEMFEDQQRGGGDGDGRRNGGGRRRSSDSFAFSRLDHDENGRLTEDELGTRLRLDLAARGTLEGGLTSDEFQRRLYAAAIKPAVGSKREGVEQARSPGEADSNAGSSAEASRELTAEGLFEPNHIVQVDVTLDPLDWRALCNQSRNFHSAVENPLAKPYTNFRADVVVDGVLIEDVAIRKKGFIGSQDRVRPSLKIKFDEYVEQQPVAGLDRLTLNNNKQDNSLLSQSMTYWLYRRAGLKAPRCTLASVTVNGMFLGVYSHVESVRKPFLQREFGDDSGNLYEGTLTDIYPKAIEWVEAKTNKKSDRARLVALAEVLDQESPTLEEIEEYVDVDHFLRFWVIESLIAFWDGYSQNQNNFFMYNDPRNGKFYFMPWGADSCFGGRHGRQGNAAVEAKGILANRLYNIEGIPERYREVMMETLSSVWDETALLAETERLETQVMDIVGFGQISAFGEMEQMRDFIRNRRQLVEMQLQRWPAYVGQPRIPRYSEKVGSAQGQFTIQCGEVGATGTGKVEGTITLHGESASIAEVRCVPGDHSDVAIVFAAVINERAYNVDFRLQADDANLAESFKAGGQHGDERFGLLEHKNYDTVRGKMELSEFSLQPGGTITGSFEARLVEPRGGFTARRRW